MDKYTGTQISTDEDKPNIVPFTECVNEIKLTVNGTHYMRWQLPFIVARINGSCQRMYDSSKWYCV